MTDDPKRPDHPDDIDQGFDESTESSQPETTDSETERPSADVAGAPPPAEEDEQRAEEKPADDDHEIVVESSDDEREPVEAAPDEEETPDESEVDQRLRRLSRRGFITMGVAAGAGYAGWKWLETRPRIDRRPWPYRRVLQANEKIASAYFDRDRLSPTFPPSRIDPLRANGRVGLDSEQDVEDWTVTLQGVAGTSGPVDVPLSEIQRLPGYEMITELRCIEGWSVVNRWTGTQLLELMRLYPPATRDGSPPDPFRRPERLVRYVSMETPGREYYVGLDMASATHPQTMLVWAMNGEPIDWRHGAPLRLAIPVKYGIKNIKRIATIRYTDQRTGDYWANRGYDWYAGF